jgi:hypothetical protein
MSPQSAGPLLLLLLPAMACGPAAPPAKQPPAAPTAVAAPPATGPCDAEAIEGELDANEAYGKTIERICVHGVPPEMNDDVRSYLRQKPGAVLTEGRLQYDLGSLFDSGFFSRVDATARSTSKSTIELSFHLEPRPTVKSFRIDGASSLASDAKERNILREGASFDPANLHRDADNLRDQYLELGLESLGEFLALRGTERLDLPGGQCGSTTTARRAWARYCALRQPQGRSQPQRGISVQEDSVRRSLGSETFAFAKTTARGVVRSSTVNLRRLV